MTVKKQDLTPYQLEQDILAFQKRYNINNYGTNNPADAFGTAYRSGYISYYYGEKVAERFVDNVTNIDSKRYNADDFRITNMKLWNSRVGLEVAKEFKDYIAKNGDFSDYTFKQKFADALFKNMINDEFILVPESEKNYDDFAGLHEIYKEDDIPSQGEPMYLSNSGDTDSNVQYETTPCVGTYRVSGYTRADGKEVASYMRSCGAKHLKKLEQSLTEIIITVKQLF